MESVVDGPLYFGAKGEVGHYVWSPNGERLGRIAHKNTRVEWFAYKDGQLAPKKDWTPGKAILHHYPEFTIVAYWDYAVDKRPGSNSMFLLPGKLSGNETISEIQKTFPDIWKRSPAVIVGVEEHGAQ